MMKKLQMLLLGLIILLSGCCRIMTGTTQELPITSYPSGAKLTTTRGHSFSTPTTLYLPRKNEYTLTAEYPGYKTQSIALKRKWNNWLWANLLWDFGIITWPIDFISGSAYEFHPKNVHFELAELIKDTTK